MKYTIEPLLIENGLNRHDMSGSDKCFYSVDVERYLNQDFLNIDRNKFYQFQIIRVENGKRYVLVSANSTKDETNSIIKKQTVQRVVTEGVGTFDFVEDANYIVDVKVGLSRELIGLIAAMDNLDETTNCGILFLSNKNHQGFLNIVDFPTEIINQAVLKQVKKEVDWWLKAFCDKLNGRLSFNNFKRFVDRTLKSDNFKELVDDKVKQERNGSDEFK